MTTLWVNFSRFEYGELCQYQNEPALFIEHQGKYSRIASFIIETDSEPTRTVLSSKLQPVFYVDENNS